MTNMANSLVGKPYVYGGGHSGWGPQSGYDCSGFVSAVLHAGGYLSQPVDTVTLPQQAGMESGPGQYVTVYDRALSGENGHVIIDINGQFYESGGSHGCRGAVAAASRRSARRQRRTWRRSRPCSTRPGSRAPPAGERLARTANRARSTADRALTFAWRYTYVQSPWSRWRRPTEYEISEEGRTATRIPSRSRTASARSAMSIWPNAVGWTWSVITRLRAPHDRRSSSSAPCSPAARANNIIQILDLGPGAGTPQIERRGERQNPVAPTTQELQSARNLASKTAGSQSGAGRR